MQAEVRCENEAGTVLRCTYSGRWHWGDFYRILESPEFTAPEQCEFVIIDYRQVTGFPPDVILNLKPAARKVKEFKGTLIVITHNAVIETLFRLFVRTYRSAGSRLYMVRNDEEAYRQLNMLSGKG